jgi:hypothetical protein
MDDYISKPVRLGDLARVLAECSMQQREMRSTLQK